MQENDKKAHAIETSKAVSNAKSTISSLPWPIDMVPVAQLRPAERNARTHSKKQIGEIAKSMAKFGVMSPVVVDNDSRIIAGHARVEAATLLGLNQYPVIRISHLNEMEIRAFALADNKLASKAGWDRELLAIDLGELRVELPKIGLDLDITGFEPGEVDTLLFDLEERQPGPEDQIPEIDESATVARPGDVFLIGNHRLLVGDARDENAYSRLMQDELAKMAFLDPPYNVRVNGHAGGRGKIKHREFSVASGEMTQAEYVAFLKATLGPCAKYTIDGGINYVCMDWRHTTELLEANAGIDGALKNICVWVKTTPGQGSFYRSQHEFVFVFKRGNQPHLNTFELGQHGRSRSNVWNYHGANMFRAGRMDELKMHPTVKPTAMIADAMRDCSQRDAIVIDVFCGSGSTIMAAEQVGRRAFCMEIDPRYIDVAVRRWQRFTGRDAILESTGQTFDEILAARTHVLTESHRGKD